MALLALAVAWALWTARAFLIDPPALGWDEGVHLENSLAALRVLTGGSVKDFLLWLDAPAYYPFVHYLIIAGSWLAFGIGEMGARVAAATVALLALPALVRLTRELGDDDGWSAVLAAALFLSGRTTAGLAGAVMLDLTGTVATLWVMVAYLAWLRAATWPRAGMVASTLLLAFFTKYNFGLLVALALLLHALLARIGFRRGAQLAMLLFVPILLWLYQEPTKKFLLLTEYVWNRRLEITLWQQISFPVVSLARDHFMAWPVGVLGVGAALLAARRIRWSSPAAAMTFFVAIQLAAQAGSSAQLPRYILPCVPLVHCLAATAIFGSRLGRVAALVATAAATGLLALAPTSWLLEKTPGWRHRHDLRATIAWIAAELHGKPAILVGGFHELSPSLGPFLGAVRRSEVPPLDRPPLFVAPPPAYGYTRERLHPATPDEARAALERAIAGYPYGTLAQRTPVVVLELPPGSPFRTRDYALYNQWGEVLARAVRDRGEAQSEARVGDLLVVKMYRFERPTNPHPLAPSP